MLYRVCFLQILHEGASKKYVRTSKGSQGVISKDVIKGTRMVDLVRVKQYLCSLIFKLYYEMVYKQGKKRLFTHSVHSRIKC